MRKDHCLLIMLGGLGPGSVALFSSIAFDRRRNSCSEHCAEHAMCQLLVPCTQSVLLGQTSGQALG